MAPTRKAIAVKGILAEPMATSMEILFSTIVIF